MRFWPASSKNRRPPLRKAVRAAVVVALLAFCPLTGVNADPQPLPTTKPVTLLEVTSGFDSLDHGYAPWHDVGVRVGRTSSRGSDVHASVESTNRFGLDDLSYGAGIVDRITRRSSFSLDTAFSGTHRVVPAASVRAEYESVAANGIGGAFAVGRRDYRVGGVTLLTGTIERYAGDSRVAFALTTSRLDGTSSGLGIHVSGARYFRDDARIQIDAATGREIESTAGVPTSIDAVNVSVSGVQPLSPGWSLPLGVEYDREGRFYSRTGIRIGIRRRS